MVDIATRTSITALCLLLAAVGCTTPERDGAEDSRGPITFVDGRDTTSGSRVAERVDRWNEAHSADEQVVFTQMPASTDAHRAQLMARAQDLADDRDRDAHESSCYDVMMLDVLWTAAFAKAGYLEQLDPAEFDADRVLPRALAAATIDGRLWAIPGRTDVGLLYYRKDLVPVPPKTWDELIGLAKTVAPKEGIHGYVGQFAQYEGLTVNAMEAVWAKGGDALSADGSTVTMNAPEAKAGVQMLAKGFADGWIPKEAAEFDEEASRKDFQQGNALFMRNWAYAYASLGAPDSPSRRSSTSRPCRGPARSAAGTWRCRGARRTSGQRGTSSASTHKTTTSAPCSRRRGWRPSCARSTTTRTCAGGSATCRCSGRASSTPATGRPPSTTTSSAA